MPLDAGLGQLHIADAHGEIRTQRFPTVDVAQERLPSEAVGVLRTMQHLVRPRSRHHGFEQFCN
jgi:hypothetical protein